MNSDIVELIRNTEKITVKKGKNFLEKRLYKSRYCKKIFPVIFQENLDNKG